MSCVARWSAGWVGSVLWVHGPLVAIASPDSPTSQLNEDARWVAHTNEGGPDWRGAVLGTPKPGSGVSSTGRERP